MTKKYKPKNKKTKKRNRFRRVKKTIRGGGETIWNKTKKYLGNAYLFTKIKTKYIAAMFSVQKQILTLHAKIKYLEHKKTDTNKLMEYKKKANNLLWYFQLLRTKFSQNEKLHETFNNTNSLSFLNSELDNQKTILNKDNIENFLKEWDEPPNVNAKNNDFRQNIKEIEDTYFS